MKTGPVQLSRFSGVELEPLLKMADLPVAWSEFFFELHKELATRDFADKENRLHALREKFTNAAKHEADLVARAMDDSQRNKKHSHLLDRRAFTESWSGGRYVPIVGTTLEFLVKPVLGESEFYQAITRPVLNKKTMIDFASKVVVDVLPFENQLLGDQIWIFNTLKKISATEVSVERKKDRISDGADVLPKKPPATPANTPGSWKESAAKIRHSKIHDKAYEISKHRGENNWADVSPLKMLGYSVDAKDGLNEKDRTEFLIDFCEQMILPAGLPKDYVAPWGDPGTKQRVLKTAKHISFVKRNFERQDLEKYARAIACWQSDFNFLQLHFSNMKISPSDWSSAAKG